MIEQVERKVIQIWKTQITLSVHFDLCDINRICHLTRAEYTFFLNTHGTSIHQNEQYKPNQVSISVSNKQNYRVCLLIIVRYRAEKQHHNFSLKRLIKLISSWKDNFKRKKERKKLSDYKKTWRKLKCILLSERSQPDYILYDSNYMTLWKSQNQRGSRKVSGSQGFRVREEGVSGAQWSLGQ